MSLRQFTNVLFSLLFLALASVAAVFLYRDYQQLQSQRSENLALEAQYSRLAEEIAEREDDLQRLSNDPEHLESVIRQKLNYAKEGETIFRFER